jgi:hypothetical protein
MTGIDILVLTIMFEVSLTIALVILGNIDLNTGEI